MKVFGYKDKIVNEHGLMEMAEVTFQAPPETLRALSKFFREAADSIEQHGDFDHAHLQEDWDNWRQTYPDIIIAGQGE